MPLSRCVKAKDLKIFWYIVNNPKKLSMLNYLETCFQFNIPQGASSSPTTVKTPGATSSPPKHRHHSKLRGIKGKGKEILDEKF